MTKLNPTCIYSLSYRTTRTFPHGTSLQDLQTEAYSNKQAPVFNEEKGLVAFNEIVQLNSITSKREANISKCSSRLLSKISNTTYYKRLFDPQTSFISFYTNGFSDDSAWNYLPSYKLIDLGKYDDKPIVSHYPKILFDQFDNFKIINFPSVREAYSAYDKLHNSYVYLSMDPSINFNKKITLNDSDVVTLFGDLPFSNLWNTEAVDISFSNKMKVIQTVSACSGSKYEFNLTTLTANQLNKNSGALVPALVPIQCASPYSSQPLDAYLFTFYYNLPLKKLLKYKKPRYYLKDFFQKTFDNFGACFFDTKLSEKITAYNFRKYVDFDYPPFATDHIQDRNLTPTHKDNVIASPSSENYSSIFSVTKLPSDFLTRKDQFNIKYRRYTSFLDSPNSSLSNAFTRVINVRKRKTRIAEDIKNLEKRLAFLKNEFLEATTSEKSFTEINSFCDNITTLCNALPALNQRQLSIQNQEVEALASAQHLEDQTYTNFMKNFDLLEITLKDSKGQKNTYNFSDASFNLDTITSSEILSFKFATKVPSRIKVSGSQERLVVGGPYIVFVTQTSLSLSLRDKSSWFGINDTAYFLHPHASSTYFDRLYTTSASACLGEASSMLYKAFTNKNLKEIILVANIWLTSANKADVWGKNYKYFRPYEEYESYIRLKDTPIEDYVGFNLPSQSYLTFEEASGAPTSSGGFLSSPPLESEDSPLPVEVSSNSYRPYSTVHLNESQT